MDWFQVLVIICLIHIPILWILITETKKDIRQFEKDIYELKVLIYKSKGEK